MAEANPFSNAGLIGGLLGGFGAIDQYNTIGNLQDTYRETIGTLPEGQSLMSQLPQDVQFKPFTVTTGTGTSGFDETGMNLGLSPEQQNIANQYQQASNQFLDSAMSGNPMLSQQANMFGSMAQGYQGTQYTPYQLSGNYMPQVDQGLNVNRFGSVTGDFNKGLESGSQTPQYQTQQEYATAYGGSPLASGGMYQALFGQQAGGDQSYFNAPQITDTVSPYGFGNAGLASMASSAMSQGMQGMNPSAPTDLENLRSQTAQSASGMLAGLGQGIGEREQEVYNRIRATQTPEEQRQALALEERLAAQGRLGVSTAQYGGTPEQLAMAKAQEEAKNSAMMSAMQQAGTEADRAYNQATGMAGTAASLAGQSSNLQTQAQQRATELSRLGMSAEQINSQLQNEGLSRATTAGQYNRQGTMLSDQLTQSAFNRALASGQYGREGQALASQLATQAQQRDLASGQFGMSQAQLMQQLQSGNIQNQLALAGGSQGALAQQLGLQSGYGQLGMGMLGASYMPQQQQLSTLAPALEAARYQQAGQETSANLMAQLGLGGLAEQTKLEQIRGDILRQAMQAAGGLGQASFGAEGATLDGMLGGFLGDLLGIGD